MKGTIKVAIAVTTAAALIAPAATQAHVTVQPNEVPAGGFTRLDVRVPNEQDDAATTKVEVEVPDGFIFASYEPVPGWSAEVKTERTAEPIESHGESFDTQVKSVTWTAEGDADGIQPGQFRDFGLSVGIPDQYAAGDVLTFPAIQTYDSGDVVRWIGGPDSEAPASQLTLSEPAAGHHGAVAEDEHSEEASDDDDGAPTWLAILGVTLGALALAVGGLALRRRS